MTKHIMLIAGEASGDLLGAAMMDELAAQMGNEVVFSGIGGEYMAKAGLVSILPLEAASSAGFTDVVRRALSLLRAIRSAANAIIKQKPDALVIIDSYDFTHRVARKVHARAPDIPIINYVPPKVWVWRPSRAKKMKKYIRRCLVIFPFEVAAMKRLGGPEAIYVGHPALERIADQRKGQEFRQKYEKNKKLVIIAPGSRAVELKHLADLFGAAAALLAERFDIQFIIPVAPTVRDLLRQKIANWPVAPVLIDNEQEKRAAFRAADAALVASGTVTMELALSGTAFVCAYRLSRIEEWVFSWLADTNIVSPVNLVLGRKAFPEFLGRAAQPDVLADAVADLLSAGAQSDALSELRQKAAVSALPSHIAAQSVRALISD